MIYYQSPVILDSIEYLILAIFVSLMWCSDFRIELIVGQNKGYYARVGLN